MHTSDGKKLAKGVADELCESCIANFLSLIYFEYVRTILRSLSKCE
jgi:hypothetical protein